MFEPMALNMEKMKLGTTEMVFSYLINSYPYYLLNWSNIYFLYMKYSQNLT